MVPLILVMALWGVPAPSVSSSNWPGFRGANASGVSEGLPTPTHWNVEKKENLLWKTAIPGLGHSSPIVWGNRVFVTTAISGKQNNDLKFGLYGDIAPVNDDSEHKWVVYCVDKRTGNILWQRIAHTG